ncbi:MAG: cytochrome b [Rhodobiaceae bacterium]|nr:cytochrome b [Rhodobiaceae bacterium]
MLTDSKHSYGWISILLHWIGAAFVIALFIIGQQMEDLRGDARAQIMMWHMSIGLLAFPVLFGRVFWRAFSGRPVEDKPVTLLDRVATLVMMLLLAAILVAILTGPIGQWSGGRPITFFGLFEIASPIGRVEWLHEAMEEVHGFAANAILPLVALHVLGAFKHLIVDRDGVFMRIVRPEARG